MTAPPFPGQQPPPPPPQTAERAGDGFRYASRRALRILALLALLAALTNALATAVMGYAVGLQPFTQAPANLFGLALIAIVGAIFLRDAVFMAVANLVEDANHRYRLAVLRRLRRLDLRALERVGADQLYFTVAGNPRKISDSANQVGKFVTMVTRLICGLLVMALLSPAAFGVVAAVLALLVASFVATTPPALAREDAADAAEGAFFSGLNGLVRGFKSLKLNQPMDQAFATAELAEPAHQAMAHKTAAGRWLALNFVLSNATKLLAAVAVLFLIPILTEGEDPAPELIAAVVVIALLPVSVLQESPVVIRAAAALRTLKGFLDRLRGHEPAPGAGAVTVAPGIPSTPTSPAAVGAPFQFQLLAAEGLAYRYTDRRGQTGFQVGPFDFALPAGSLTFIVGGNGSGKTTLLKLLTALYQPTAGAVRINDSVADAALRSRFVSSVFANPFLFRHLYGLRGIDPAIVTAQLRDLGLDHVTLYDPQRGFSRLELSAGQRKRLALAVALLEDRPLLILDEFAADQDPAFRRRFYTELLPRWRAAGRTVIAVTHDDAYFGVADRILALEEGRLREHAAGSGQPRW